MPVTASWTDYYKTLSSRITGNLRRVKTRSKALGDTSIAILTPAESDVKALLDEIVRVEGSGWKGRRGSALAQNLPLCTFFEHYSLRAARDGILRVALLRFGDSVAAAELAIVAYRRWWQLKIGYAEEFAKHYPGLQLTEGTLQYAFDHALDSYEFLGSSASWEANWRPETHRQRMAAVYPSSVSGLHAFSVDACLMVGRRAAEFTESYRHSSAPGSPAVTNFKHWWTARSTITQLALLSVAVIFLIELVGLMLGGAVNAEQTRLPGIDKVLHFLGFAALSLTISELLRRTAPGLRSPVSSCRCCWRWSPPEMKRGRRTILSATSISVTSSPAGVELRSPVAGACGGNSPRLPW